MQKPSQRSCWNPVHAVIFGETHETQTNMAEYSLQSANKRFQNVITCNNCISYCNHILRISSSLTHHDNVAKLHASLLQARISFVWHACLLFFVDHTKPPGLDYSYHTDLQKSSYSILYIQCVLWIHMETTWKILSAIFLSYRFKFNKSSVFNITQK